MSNAIWLKKVIDKCKRRGVSMRATKSSKYSLTPLNLSEVRTCRTERLREADVGLPGRGKVEGIGIHPRVI